MKWLLDTNVLSEAFKPSPDAKVLDWLEEQEEDVVLSAISIGEMKLGIERLPDGKRKRGLEKNFEFLQQDFGGKVLEFTEGVAVEWGRLVAEAEKTGRILSVLDSQIEATALHHGLTVVSRNAADFFHPVFNPWTGRK